MAVKIAKAAASNVVGIGESDYPLDSFRAKYGADHVELIPRSTEIIQATRLKFKYSDIVDGDDAAVGTDEATVRAYLQAQLYSATPETGSGE